MHLCGADAHRAYDRLAITSGVTGARRGGC